MKGGIFSIVFCEQNLATGRDLIEICGLSGLQAFVSTTL
jgi:hypothetical protein